MVISPNNRISRDGNVCPKKTVLHHFEKRPSPSHHKKINHRASLSRYLKEFFRDVFFCLDPIHKKQAINDFLAVFNKKSWEQKMMFIVQENYVIENTRLTNVFKLVPVVGEWCWMISIFLPEQKLFILDGFCEEKIP